MPKTRPEEDRAHLQFSKSTSSTAHPKKLSTNQTKLNLTSKETVYKLQ